MNERAMALGTNRGPRPKLTVAECTTIRRAYAEGKRFIDLEARWHVSRGTISAVIRGTYCAILGQSNISRGRGMPKGVRRGRNGTFRSAC